MNSELLKKLTNLTAHRKPRLEVSDFVILNPEMFPELLNYCFKIDDDISFKAAWTLEFVCENKIELLIKHFDLFFKHLPNIYKDQALRPFSKICLFIIENHYKKKKIQLNSKQKEIITECCFDWLISNQKVATEAYAMSSLFYLGTEIDWIHPDLKQIILQNINSKSAAYKARGRITIEKIDKFQLKKRNS